MSYICFERDVIFSVQYEHQSFFLLCHYRRCNGKRGWISTPGIEAQPEYECSAFGQGHIETFDGLMYNFDNIGCR